MKKVMLSMGKRGPQKKPTAIKAIEGNPGKRALPVEPEIPADDVKSFRGTAEEYWAHFEPVCKAVGVLTNADVAAFKIMCEQLAEYDATVRDMDLCTAKHSDTYERLFNRMCKLTPIIMRYLDRFGLTPTSRADLGTLKRPGGESEFEKKRKAKLKKVQ